MSRILTSRPAKHPHNQLKIFEGNIYDAYRKLSAEALKLTANEMGFVEYDRLNTHPKKSPSERKRMLEFLVLCGTLKWKALWKERIGWDFDDVYDPVKFKRHLAEDQLRQQQARQSGANKLPSSSDAMPDTQSGL